MNSIRKMHVPFSYLNRQFENVEPYLDDIRKFVKTGDFTLGAPLRKFEKRFAAVCGAPYAIGVASGTDALMLSMEVLGIGRGDEVITTPMTFIATVGAIVAIGARPIFVDSEDGFVIDASKIEKAVTSKTKAIVPVHYTGNVVNMPVVMKVARKYGLFVVEDACQAVAAKLNGLPVGSWGQTACFSLHPLKNLNVWSDGGIIATRSKRLSERIRLYRNHGLANRDQVTMFGRNSRLDTLQAVIGNRLIRKVEFITEQRIANAKRYDEALSDLGDFVRVPKRRPGVKHVYHLYMIRCKDRDRLLNYLNQNGIEAKVHYPVPVHLQKAAKHLGYKKGDFPVCERDSRDIITLPAHQHLTSAEMNHVIERIHSFYLKPKGR